MHLLDLPAEILRQVSSETIPDDFESASLSCRHLHAVGAGFVAEHNALKKRFSHVRVRVWDIPEYVLGVVRHPEISHYVKSLSIPESRRATADAGLLWLREDARQHPPAESVSALLERGLEDNPWIKATGGDTNRWAQYLARELSLARAARRENDGHEDGDSDDENDDEMERRRVLGMKALVILLAFLPRLRSLNATGVVFEPDPNGDGPDEDITALLELMSARIGTSADAILSAPTNHMTPENKERLRLTRKLAVSPMAELREFHHVTTPEYDNKVAARDLNAFLTSPNLRSFHATNLVAVDDYTGENYDWPGRDVWNDDDGTLLSERKWVGIETLELVSCCMDGEESGKLFEKLPRLKVLRYSHETKWHGCLHDWPAGEFVETIKSTQVPVLSPSGEVEIDEQEGTSRPRTRPLAWQLTDLSITIDTQHGETEVGARCFRDFTALKRLAVDVKIFLGPDPESGERIGSDPRPPETPGFGHWKDEPILPALVDMLPSGLEVLEFFVDRSRREQKYKSWPDLWKGFAQRRAELLPALRTVTIMEDAKGIRDVSDEERDALAAGDPGSTRRVADQAEVEYVYGHTARPSWMVDFDRAAGVEQV